MKRMPFLLVGLWGWSPAAAAQVAAPLTPAEAVRSALSTHPTMVAARAAVERAAAGVREATAARRPAVGVETTAIRFAEPMVVAPLHGFDPQAPPAFDRVLVQASATVSWALFDAVRGPDLRRARAVEEASRHADKAARQTLIARTLLVYLDVVAARDEMTVHEARIAALERERERASRFFDAGRAARVTVLRAEAALSAARAELVASREETDLAERTLARLMGVDPELLSGRSFVRVRLTPAAVRYTRADVLRGAGAASTEIAVHQSQVEAANAARAQASALRLPRVELSARFVEYAAGRGLESAEWQGGVRLTYPFLTGGMTGAAVDRANAEHAAARAELAGVELSVAGAIDAAIARMAAAGERTRSFEVAVARAEEVVRIERLALDAGAGVQSDYLNAEADLLAMRSALTDARRDFTAARIELALASGELTEIWLTESLEAAS